MTAVKESNHTLSCLWLFGDARNAVVSAQGVDDANLLFASLELNQNWLLRDNTSSITRQKMIWAHAARGGINIADSDIPDGAMPIILSWFGDYSSEETAKLIHTTILHFLKKQLRRTKRLDSLYRIIHDMPDLCQNDPKSVEDVSQLTDTLALTSLAHTSLGQ